VVLTARPERIPQRSDFSVRSVRVAAPAEGEVVIRTLMTSVDPGMLPRLRAMRSYAAPYELGEVVRAGSLGQVLVSNAAGVPAGSWVLTDSGWCEYATVRVTAADIADPGMGSPEVWMSVLNMTGITAWLGLHEFGGLGEGDTVVVNAAAGAVGGVAVQLAKAAGATVVAIAGRSDKIAHARERLGADAAIDYTAGDIGAALDIAAPDGIDLLFDNVGGAQLATLITRLRPHGRAVLCGRISETSGASASVPLDLARAVPDRLSVRGFVVTDHLARWPRVRRQLSSLVASGDLVPVTTVVDGIENAPDTLAGLFRSGASHLGKLLIRTAAPDGTASGK
jgi:hypothetical protein